VIQLGTSAFMVANLHCMYLVSKPAREMMDRLDPRRRASQESHGGGGDGDVDRSGGSSVATTQIEMRMTSSRPRRPPPQRQTLPLRR